MGLSATELRIGNYHLYHIVDPMDERGEYDEVCQIDVEDFRILESFDCPEYKPIPLTEKWLLKFGFKRVDMMFENASMLYWRKDDFIINDERNVILFNDKETMMKIHCEYVHQLQNLYFALTGEELIVSFNRDDKIIKKRTDNEAGL